MIKYGSPRLTEVSVDETWLEEEELVNEKQRYQEMNEIKSKKHLGQKIPLNYRNLFHFVLVCTTFFWIFLGVKTGRILYTNLESLSIAEGVPSATPRQFHLGSVVDTGSGLFSTKNESAHEIISVGYPDIPRHTYGKSVHQMTLIDATFGNSWGKPVVSQFNPPNIDFNKVVLTLKTEVDGVQYDRLINIFVGGAQIWRTSTIEPGNSKVFSTAKKDVSLYLTLFKQKTDILFQLDNLLNKRLTGKFKILLVADFYNTDDNVVTDNNVVTDDNVVTDEINTSDDLVVAGSNNPFLISYNKPADQVYPLIKSKNTNNPPLSYLPSDKVMVNLPKVSDSTSKLKLAIFTSGNAQEEFWYGNVLDRFKDRFAKNGRPLPGHGPVRIVNVYFNGDKILTQTPEPIIYTGGISPALWSAVVSNNAFDIRALELDVTGLLPVLWESQGIEDRILEIEISNGLGETGDSDKDIGENWITSANLLTYENDQIESVSGSIVDISSSKSSNIVAISPPYTDFIQQVIDAKFKSSIVSDLSFKLKNGETYDSTIFTNTSATVRNVQSYKRYAAQQNLVHLGKSSKSFTVTEGDKQIHQVTSEVTYPFVLNLRETEKKVDSQEFKIVYDVNLVAGSKMRVTKNKKEMILKISAFQNGTSQYILSSDGNYGTAEIDTNYTLNVFKHKKPTHHYNRYVKAANRTILSDDVEEDRPKGVLVTEMLEDTDFDTMFNALSLGLIGNNNNVESECPFSRVLVTLISTIKELGFQFKQFISNKFPTF